MGSDAICLIGERAAYQISEKYTDGMLVKTNPYMLIPFLVTTTWL